MTAPPLMVFAAGFGTRMGRLTRDRPKPLVEVAGESLLARAVALGREAGCAPIVANTHYLAGLMRPVLAALRVTEAHEEPILETGGGLRAALPHLGAEVVATLNPDAVWTGPNPLSALIAAWPGLPQGAEALLMLVPRGRALAHSGQGDFLRAADGRLSRPAGGAAAALVYGGAQILRTRAVAEGPEGAFSLTRVWEGMAARGTLFGLVHPGGWVDVGTEAGIAAAEGLLAGADGEAENG